MKKISLHSLILLPMLLVLIASGNLRAQGLLPSFGGDRSATAGFQFTKINVDARSAALGSSNMADAVGAAAMYWNPALAAQGEGTEVMFGYTSYFVDIPMNYTGALYRVGDFTFGASLQYLTSGDMAVTTEFRPFGNGQQFRTTHYTIGLTAAQKLTDSFSYGLTLRYLNEGIFDVDISTVGLDFGFFYAVGTTGLRFGVGISNFGLDATPSGSISRPDIEGQGEDIVITEFADVVLPTRFSIAAAYDVIKSEQHSLLLTSQVTNPADNAEQFSFGAEYGFLGQFFLRTGYQLGLDENDLPSLGAGLKIPFSGRSLIFDYAYNSFERLGAVNRIAVRITL
jgi:hypothetical protein